MTISGATSPIGTYDPQLSLFPDLQPKQPLALEERWYWPPSEQLPLWYEPGDVAMTQYPSARTPDATTDGNGNCGPTSAVMALRLVGKDIPEFAGERTQRAIDVARLIATGANDGNDWTDTEEMRKVLEAGGARVRQSADVSDTLDAVRSGKVVMILGNVNTTGWPGGSYIPPTYGKDNWSGHWIVASRYNADRDAITINDPGDEYPYHVTPDQLRRFATGGDGSTINQGAYALVVEGPSTDLRPPIVRDGDQSWVGTTYEHTRQRLGNVWDAEAAAAQLAARGTRGPEAEYVGKHRAGN